MNESQAREVIALAEFMAGLSDEEPSHEQWKLFLFYVIRPIFLSQKNAAVLKKYSIENPKGLIAQLMILDANDEIGFDLRKAFHKSIQAVQTSQDMNLDPVAYASYLAKFLRKGFWWKITEMEKSLRTTLQDALNHKNFEHSGESGSLFSSRNYWPAGMMKWEVFDGDLDEFINLYPPGVKAAYPDDKTQLPSTGELRQAIVQIFDSLHSKIWFKTFLMWLNSEESPYHVKPFNPDTDVGPPSEPPPPNGPSFEELLDRAEQILSGLKPQYQQTFKMAYIWYKKYWDKSTLGYKELEIVTGKKTSVLHEHFKKIENLFIKPLMERSLHGKELLREVFDSFREKYSEHNPEKTHPELFRDVNES